MLNALSNQNSVEEGARFRRRVGSAMVETAEVLEVAGDKMGIPHVRFQLRVVYGTTNTAAPEQRTLALDTFYARYRERV
ncbi:MAG TPA: hypothetical protein VFR09_07600 [Alphaproteobacteria bacterium]|nr:hypothetical protein [Alphaproteobacteria bacterium]